VTRSRRLLLYISLGAWILTFLRALDHALVIADRCAR
jgi:hypothetical protein